MLRQLCLNLINAERRKEQKSQEVEKILERNDNNGEDEGGEILLNKDTCLM